MNPLDKTYSASYLKITDRQTDFIIDNIDLIEDEERQEQIIKKLDFMSRDEAAKIISEIIEYKNYLEQEGSFMGTHPNFYD